MAATIGSSCAFIDSRRRRHEFMYETAAEPGAQELATARDDVMKLIAIARERISRAT